MSVKEKEPVVSQVWYLKFGETEYTLETKVKESQKYDLTNFGDMYKIVLQSQLRYTEIDDLQEVTVPILKEEILVNA